MPKIENTTIRLITLPMNGYDPLNIPPGKMEVDDDHWEDLLAKHGKKGNKAKKIPNGFLKTMMIEGAIRIYTEDDDDDDDDVEDTPKGVPGNAKDAIANVSLTDDVEKLEAWSAGEKRSTVLKAIDDQLEELKDMAEAD